MAKLGLCTNRDLSGAFLNFILINMSFKCIPGARWCTADPRAKAIIHVQLDHHDRQTGEISQIW